MLLIDHDDTQVRHRREDRRACADHDPPLAAGDRAPRVGPLALRQGAVQHRDRVAEHPAHPGHGLGRERDLRDQHDRPATTRHLDPHGIQIHQRLSAARHAEEERGASRREAFDRPDGCALGFGRLRRGLSGHIAERIAQRGPLLDARYAALHQTPHHRGGQPEPGPQVADVRLAPERIQRLVGGPLFLGPSEDLVSLEQGGQRPREPQDGDGTGLGAKTWWFGLQRHGAGSGETLQHVPHRPPERSRQRGGGRAPAGTFQCLDHRPADPPARRSGIAQLRHQPRRPPKRWREHRSKGEPERGGVVARHPSRELEQVRGYERGCIGSQQDRFQVLARFRKDLDHDSHQLAGPDRDHDPHAGRHPVGQRGRDAIVVRPRNGKRQDDRATGRNHRRRFLPWSTLRPALVGAQPRPRECAPARTRLRAPRRSARRERAIHESIRRSPRVRG